MNMGTRELNITPFKKDITAISGEVTSDISGRVVSIEVAPAGAMVV